MPEPMTIAASIAAVKNGFDIAKSIREEIKKPTLDRNEVASQLLLLQDIMLDTQRALNDAESELRQLQTRLDSANELEADKLWEPDGSFYLRKSAKAEGTSFLTAQSAGLRPRPRFRWPRTLSQEPTNAVCMTRCTAPQRMRSTTKWSARKSETSISEAARILG